jgi:hypothetical protein
MSLEQRSKKELVEIIHELKEKLKEVKGVEAQATATVEELKQYGVGLYKNNKGQYFLVKLRYDQVTKAAVVEALVDLHSTDPAIATFKLKEYAVETIMRKARGGKYV